MTKALGERQACDSIANRIAQTAALRLVVWHEFSYERADGVQAPPARHPGLSDSVDLRIFESSFDTPRLLARLPV
jgi:hypothetical protein